MRLGALLSGVVVAGAVLSAVPSRLPAQGFSVSVRVDEKGHGTLSNTSEYSSSLSATTAQDPGPGGLSNALTYNLQSPPGLTIGDLFINDFGTGVLSDLVRFSPENSGSLIFYSMAGGGDLADTGFPTANYALTFTGVENADGTYDYTPTQGQPGFVAQAGGPVTYHIASTTTTPEPETLALLGTGLVGLVPVARRRRA